MLNPKKLTCIIESENSGFLATNPEYSLTGHGTSEEEALKNLKSSLEEYFKTSSPNPVEPLDYQLCITDI